VESPTGRATDRVAHAPIRTCVGCRRRAVSSQLLRVILRDGFAVVDQQPRSPGRGAYVCRDERCAQRALRHDGAPLRRALRADAGVVVDGEGLRARARQAHRREGVST